jgi:heterodisulfide reductase subunit C
VVLGFREKVLSSDELWYCTTCYTCQERCPRGVKTTEIIRILRNIAAKEGYMSKSHKMAAGQVFKTGHAVAINEEIQNVREELGLSRLPPTTHSYPEALAKLQDILRRTHFDELVGFDWETMELNEV